MALTEVRGALQFAGLSPPASTSDSSDAQQDFLFLHRVGHLNENDC